MNHDIAGNLFLTCLGDDFQDFLDDMDPARSVMERDFLRLFHDHMQQFQDAYEIAQGNPVNYNLHARVVESHRDMITWLRHHGTNLRLLQRLSVGFPDMYNDILMEISRTRTPHDTQTRDHQNQSASNVSIANDLPDYRQRFQRSAWNRISDHIPEKSWHLKHDPETMDRLYQISAISVPVSDRHTNNYNFNIMRIHDEGLQEYLRVPTPQALDEIHKRTSQRMNVLEFLHHGDHTGIFNRQVYPEHQLIHEHLRTFNLHNPANEDDRQQLYLETLQEPQHRIGGSTCFMVHTYDHDPTPRAHMALQTHDSRMFSRMARELVGGGCRSFPVYYGSGNMLPTGNRPQAQHQPPAVQGVLNIRNVANPGAVDAPVVGIPVHVNPRHAEAINMWNVAIEDPQWREIKQRMSANRNLDSTNPTRRYYERLYKEALDGWVADYTTDPTAGDSELTTRLAQLELDLQTRTGQIPMRVRF